MSDVLPPSNQESLPSGPNVPPKNQAAIERLRKRMEGYRDMQTNRLPQYEDTMNQVNKLQMQETLVLRQKFLENKAKKPNKKSSSGSGDKMKHDLASGGPGNMNGMMQYHAGPPSGPPGSMNGPQMAQSMNGPPMGLNGPPSHNGPMLLNGPNNMMNHGPNNGPSHNKRPLEDDSSTIPSDTAKRLNLDNGNISDQNFIKREPSPLETKFNPGGVSGVGGHQPPPVSQTAKPPAPEPSPLPDVKPNVNSLNQEMKDNMSDNKMHELSDSKDDLKAEVSDSLKQEDTLGDLDLKDFDFDGMNADSLQDLMDDLPENFIDDFDFENSKIASDGKDSEDANVGSETGETTPVSSSCHTTTSNNSSSTSTSVSGAGANNMSGSSNTPAAEHLKLMAQQHQHPPSSQSGGPPYQSGPGGGPVAPGGPPMPPNTSMPNYQASSHASAMPSGGQQGPGSMTSSIPNHMNYTNSMSDSTASSQNMMGPGPGGPGGQRGPGVPNHPGGPVHQPGQDADPRLRAAVQQRFRLGNPNSIANSMAAGPGAGNPGMNSHPSMMGNMPSHRMPMANTNMMGNMPSNQQGPGPGGIGANMQMMGQQQVNRNDISAFLSTKRW